MFISSLVVCEPALEQEVGRELLVLVARKVGLDSLSAGEAQSLKLWEKAREVSKCKASS